MVECTESPMLSLYKEALRLNGLIVTVTIVYLQLVGVIFVSRCLNQDSTVFEIVPASATADVTFSTILCTE